VCRVFPAAGSMPLQSSNWRFVYEATSTSGDLPIDTKGFIFLLDGSFHPPGAHDQLLLKNLLVTAAVQFVNRHMSSQASVVATYPLLVPVQRVYPEDFLAARTSYLVLDALTKAYDDFWGGDTRADRQQVPRPASEGGDGGRRGGLSLPAQQLHKRLGVEEPPPAARGMSADGHGDRRASLPLPGLGLGRRGLSSGPLAEDRGTQAGRGGPPIADLDYLGRRPSLSSLRPPSAMPSSSAFLPQTAPSWRPPQDPTPMADQGKRALGAGHPPSHGSERHLSTNAAAILRATSALEALAALPPSSIRKYSKPPDPLAGAKRGSQFLPIETPHDAKRTRFSTPPLVAPLPQPGSLTDAATHARSPFVPAPMAMAPPRDSVLDVGRGGGSPSGISLLGLVAGRQQSVEIPAAAAGTPLVSSGEARATVDLGKASDHDGSTSPFLDPTGSAAAAVLTNAALDKARLV
jgi:hypothetical protein